MIEERDTICAVSTPPGVGGIAVVRVSGPRALAIADSVWRGKRLSDVTSHTVHFGTVFDPSAGCDLDQSVATVFRAPSSFTGDDVVELSLHGSRYVQREAVNLLIRNGCRLAEPGEFTRRAFAAGKMDLAEAEAVADVIASTSRASHRVAVSQMRGDLSRKLESLRSRLLDLASLLELELDFSEEDVEFASREKLIAIAGEAVALTGALCDSYSTGQALRDGIPVVILGKTNAGKSTLLNRLTGHDRAIVSDIHGTTRDTIDDLIEISGIPFRIIDTAGLRLTDDPIESLGIERTLKAASRAKIILHLIDATELSREDIVAAEEGVAGELAAIAPGFRMPEGARMIRLLNKVDLLEGNSCVGAVEGESNSCAVTVEGETAGVAMTPGLHDGQMEPQDCRRENLDGNVKPLDDFIQVSARTGYGIERLKSALVKASGMADALEGDAIMLTNSRHYEALLHATASLNAVLSGLQTGLSGDFIAQDLREALLHIGSVTGSAITTPEILSTIFSRFCVGK